MKKIVIILTVLIPFFVNAQLSWNSVAFHISNAKEVGFGTANICSENLTRIATINYGADGLPVGGYIDNGIQKKDWVDPQSVGGNFEVDNGIVGVTKYGDIFISEYTNLNLPGISTSDVAWALQSGPILVIGGKNIRGTSTSIFARSAIGITENGELMLIYSTGATLRQFADICIDYGCKNAILIHSGNLNVVQDERNFYGESKLDSSNKNLKLQFFH